MAGPVHKAVCTNLVVYTVKSYTQAVSAPPSFLMYTRCLAHGRGATQTKV